MDTADTSLETLHQACSDNAPFDVIRELVQHGGGKDFVIATDKEGQNALIHAVKNGQSIQVIKLLIECGDKESVIATDKRGRNALIHALAAAQPAEVIHLLVECGGKESVIATESKELEERNGAIELLEIEDSSVLSLSESEELSESKQNLGRNTLMYAVKTQPFVVIKLLIEHGGKEMINHTDKRKRNTLMHAFSKSMQSTEVIKLLVESGGKEAVTYTDDKGMNALMHALNSMDMFDNNNNIQSIQAIKLLIECGGKEIMNQTDEEYGWNALMYAIEYRQSTEIIKLLIECGGRETVTHIDESGLNALIRAIFHDQPIEVIQFLVEYGGKEAVTWGCNAGGCNAVRMALETDQNEEILELLVKYGGGEALFDISRQVKPEQAMFFVYYTSAGDYYMTDYVW